MPAKAGRSASHIPELDGIRGLAIVLVIFYHFGQSDTADLQSSVLGFGKVGVDLFFALSGFLITGILLETKSSLNYFRIFYLRRILRIFPLYALILLTFFHVAVPVAHHLHKWQNMATDTEPWYWVYLANWVIGHHRSISLLVPFWSLSVEEQFYAIWPVVVLWVSERLLIYVSAGVIVTAVVLRCVCSLDPEGIFVYVWTPFRMDSLAMGALIAILYRNRSWVLAHSRWLNGIGLASLAAAVSLYARSEAHLGAALYMRFGYTLLAVAFSSLVLRCAIRTGSGDTLSRLMRNKALMRVGTVSYGLYLLHYSFVSPVSSAMTLAERRIPLPPAIHALLMILIGGLLSYGAAEVSWRLLERRVLSLKSRWPYRYPEPALVEGLVASQGSLPVA